MAAPAIYKKNVEITPLQERLLRFFENDNLDLPEKIKSYEWIFEEILYCSVNSLTIEHRTHLANLNELTKILKGIDQGF